MVCSPEQEKVGTGSIEAIICPVYGDLRIRATVSKEQYFLCTDLTLSAQNILSIYQKRWPIEVDNFYVKQH